MNLRCLLTLLFALARLQLSAKDYAASYFGIHSDGATLNTTSIQFAVDYINRNGGGRLVFHVGRYLTGTIHMRSGVTLQLEEGAVLLGSLNPFDYQSRTNPYMTALLFADSVENIGITGAGMIDGQGKQLARNYVDIIDKGLIKDKFRNGRPEVETRPMIIYFRKCRNIVVRGIMLKNSGSWNQTYDQCRNVTIDSIAVNNKDFWNEDGVDIVDCDSATITHSFFDVADDGICFKSHDARFFCNNILVSNNTIRSSANAIKFGTVSRGGCKNIRIINNKVYDTYRSAVALQAVDGGFVENVEIDGLRVYNTGNVIFLRVGERWGEKTSSMHQVSIKNVVAEVPATKPDAGYPYEGPVEDMPRNISPGIVITGVPGKLITGIMISNIEINHPGGGIALYARVDTAHVNAVPELQAKYPEFSMFKELPAWGIYIRHAQDVTCSNIALTAARKDYRPAIVTDDVHKAHLSHVVVTQQEKSAVMYQYNCSDVSTEKMVVKQHVH